MESHSVEESSADISIRPMTARDVPEADRVFRLAFATHLGVSPETFMDDRDVMRGRFVTNPGGTIVATDAHEFAGSNVVTNWGSFGWFGPLTVHPRYWGKGVAQRLLERTLEIFAAWGTRCSALFTFADSPKHHRLYQRFDYWPRFLTAIMSKPAAPALQAISPRFTRYSELSASDQRACLGAAFELGNEIFAGLDLRSELQGLQAQKIGDSIWLMAGSRVEGFALCHFGTGSEATAGSCYVKFAAARPGKSGQRTFDDLLDACDALALREGLTSVEAGVNLERTAAYQTLLRHNYRAGFCGVCMLRGNERGYNRPDVFLIDDLR